MRSAEKLDAGKRLTRLVSWAQVLVGEVLNSGDLAVDLTAGTGRDTLFLFRQVGPTGRVLVFDIQEAALQATARLLEQAGARVGLRSATAVSLPPGVHLVADSHTALDRYLSERPRGIIANLGYLPGGDPAVTTGMRNTLCALDQGCRLLASGGRIAVTVYVGHGGGEEEGEGVKRFFAALSSREWDVLMMEIPNRPSSPFLVVAEKSAKKADAGIR